MAHDQDLRGDIIRQTVQLEEIRSTLHSLGNVLRDVLVAIQGIDRVEADQHGRVLGAIEEAQGQIQDLERRVEDLARQATAAAVATERMGEILELLAQDRMLLQEIAGLAPSARPLPLVTQIQEMRRTGREAAGRDPETGAPVEGMAKWGPLLARAAVLGIASALGVAAWTWVAPHVGRVLINSGKPSLQAPQDGNHAPK